MPLGSDPIGSIENRCAKKLRGTNDLYAQQMSVGIEVKDDVAPPGELDDDVLDGSAVDDVIELQVGSIRFAVVRNSRDAFDHLQRPGGRIRGTDLPPSARGGGWTAVTWCDTSRVGACALVTKQCNRQLAVGLEVSRGQAVGGRGLR